MKGISLSVIYFIVCFKQFYLFNKHVPTVGLCIIADLFVPISAFYEEADEVYEPEYYEESGSTVEVNKSNLKVNMISSNVRNKLVDDYEKNYISKHNDKPLPTRMTVPTVVDEWKLRGTYRLQCLEENRVPPSKVVTLMSKRVWENEDVDLQRWVLCVLVKMGIMTTEGVFKMDVAMSKIRPDDKDYAETLINLCLPTKNMLPRQIAWYYVKCHDKAKGNFSAISVF